MIDREKLAAAALSCGILKDSQLYQDLLEVVGKYEEISMTDTPTEGMKRKALKDMSPAELEHMELKAIADALAEAQRLLEGGAPAGRYSWLDAPVELAAARASTQPSRPQGGGESWHERLVRLVKAKDYPAALALLRAPAPDPLQTLGADLDRAYETPLPDIQTLVARPQGEEGLWRPISEAPRDGREIVFINQFAHCSDVVHWRAPYTKHGLGFPGRFENRSGHSTGMNDDVAWLFWTPSPLPALSNQGKASS